MRDNAVDRADECDDETSLREGGDLYDAGWARSVFLCTAGRASLLEGRWRVGQDCAGRPAPVLFCSCLLRSFSLLGPAADLLSSSSDTDCGTFFFGVWSVTSGPLVGCSNQPAQERPSPGRKSSSWQIRPSSVYPETITIFSASPPSGYPPPARETTEGALPPPPASALAACVTAPRP